jgi:ectoine hydroxylase-related dioxygenase (phytanoyl-CoA dioxygenase family)
MPSRPTPRAGVVTAAATAASITGILGALYYLDIPSLFQQRIKSRKVEPRCYSAQDEDQPSLAAFRILTQQVTLKETYPLAAAIEKNIPIYDCSKFKLEDEKWLGRLQDEWYHILLHGPGVFVLKHFFADLTAIDAASEAYARIIAQEAESNGAKGDHFAPGSANNRIWNSFSKHALEDPESFVQYFSNPLFRLASEAWLGPAYRLTAQVNIVKPGGKAQTSHRDYHLGFQTAEDVAKWPKAMHTASQLLTLQGAVAHSDMPLESGPTRFLPFSQVFEEGFMAYRSLEFQDYFLQNWVSLPLEKGDAVFFHPALFHAAGENKTGTDGRPGVERSANLIQVSSAFGKTMETIDTIPIVERCWDAALEKHRQADCGGKDELTPELDALIRALGEGYPFPTNLDRRPPAPGGMAPESEQDLLRRGMLEGWSKETMIEELRKMRADSSA